MRDFEVELLQKYTVKVLDSNRICCPRSTLSNSPVHPVRSPATGPLCQLTAPFNAFTVKFKIRAHFKSSAGWLDHGNASAGWLDCSQYEVLSATIIVTFMNVSSSDSDDSYAV